METPRNPDNRATCDRKGVKRCYSEIKPSLCPRDLRVAHMSTNRKNSGKSVIRCSRRRVSAKKKRLTGYSGVLTYELLLYLFDNYSQITSNTLNQKNATMQAKWDPIELFKSFLERIEDCKAYAEAGKSPYTAKQVMDIAYQVMYNTGVFTNECKRWHRKPEESK